MENDSPSSPAPRPNPPPSRPPEIGDMVHPFSRLSPDTNVTFALLGIIVVIFLLQSVEQPNFFNVTWPSCFGGSKILHDWASCGPAMIQGGELWRLFTLMFLHGNAAHIGFNALALYSLGMDMERIYGRYRFLFIYIFGGLVGSLLSFLVSGPREFSVGASGAIFAVAGMNLAFFYSYRNKLGKFGEERFRSMLRVVGINLVIGFVLIRVNNLAHIGGLLGGAALGYLFLPWYTVTETIPDVRVADSNSLKAKSGQAAAVVFVIIGAALAIWYYWRFLYV